MSLALEWVARIMAVSLLMFLPGVAGQWLDKRFGTSFLTLVGFGFGFCAGLGVLLVMVDPKKKTALDLAGSEVSSSESDQDNGRNSNGRNSNGRNSNGRNSNGKIGE